MLAGEETFGPTCAPSLAAADSNLLFSAAAALLLEAIRKIRLPIAVHANLNLVQTLAHAARLPSSHLIQRKLLRTADTSAALTMVLRLLLMLLLVGVH